MARKSASTCTRMSKRGLPRPTILTDLINVLIGRSLGTISLEERPKAKQKSQVNEGRSDRSFWSRDSPHCRRCCPRRCGPGSIVETITPSAPQEWTLILLQCQKMINGGLLRKKGISAFHDLLSRRAPRTMGGKRGHARGSKKEGLFCSLFKIKKNFRCSYFCSSWSTLVHGTPALFYVCVSRKRCRRKQAKRGANRCAPVKKDETWEERGKRDNHKKKKKGYN